MLNLWQRIDRFFESFGRKTSATIGGATDTHINVSVINGHIDIRGAYSSLTINGRRVRLVEKKK